MKTSFRIAVTTLVVLLAALPSLAQLPRDPEERAKAIAQIMSANSRQLTIFDREGKELQLLPTKDLYAQPVFSPDSKRVAVVRTDLDKENNDLWVVDLATGNRVQISHGGSRETTNAPAWSPDGAYVAYVGQRQGSFGLFRKLSNGQGEEEVLFKSNAPVVLNDWSMDGKYLTYYSSDLGGGALFALPMAGSGERKPIEVLRSKFQLTGPRLSPDGRFISYISNETGRTELYVRPFNPNAAPGAPSAGPWKLSETGAQGMAFWRRDGKELTYLGVDRGVWSVSLTTTPDFEFSKAKLLFRPSEAIPVPANMASSNRDQNRFVIAVPPPQLRQITLFDREGKVVNTVGPAARYGEVRFSPDGKRLLAVRNDPETGVNNIWVYEIGTGKATQVTTEKNDSVATPVWSRDGKYIAYTLFKDSYSQIFRKVADGTGQPELLFRYTPGAFVGLTDWSADGKFLTFSTGVLLVVPVTTAEKPLDRKALEWLREDFDAFGGRFSPDGRFLAFMSNEGQADIGSMQVFVRPFDANKPNAPAGPGVQITKLKGGAGGIAWRQDGKELFFMTRDRELMSVDINSGSTFQAGMPKLLFKVSDPLVGGGDIRADGQQIVLAMPAK